MPKHLNIKIYGQVQGVGFRMHAKELAQDLEINGFVRNELDEAVEAIYLEIEGEPSSLTTFLRWCQEGPEFAQVEDIKITEGRLVNFNNFDIK